MRRNLTIIGSSDALILVESGLNGGTFAAGKKTLARQRPLFVIDSGAPEPTAPANPSFIQRGGKPIRRSQDGKPNLAAVKRTVEMQTWARAEQPSLFS